MPEITEAYLTLRNTPPVLLCEAMQAAVGTMMFLQMGRAAGAVERYLCTRRVLDQLRRVSDDPRHAAMDPDAPEAAAHGRLLAAMGAILGGAVPSRGAPPAVPGPYDEFSIRGSLISALRQATIADDARPYAPRGPRFMEVRAALYEAAGAPRPDTATPSRNQHR